MSGSRWKREKLTPNPCFSEGIRFWGFTALRELHVLSNRPSSFPVRTQRSPRHPSHPDISLSLFPQARKTAQERRKPLAPARLRHRHSCTPPGAQARTIACSVSGQPAGPSLPGHRALSLASLPHLLPRWLHTLLNVPF